MTSIYLAARYGRRDELVEYMNDIEEIGYEVTSRWLKTDHYAADAELGPSSLGTKFAQEDVDDVAKADVLIAFTEGAHTGPSRGGRHFETGLAYALGSQLILVGPYENVFHCLSGIERYEDWDECYEYLSRRREKEDDWDAFYEFLDVSVMDHTHGG